MFRLEFGSLLCALVVEVIRACKVLNIGIAYCETGVLTTLLKGQFKVRLEVLKYHLTVALTID
jgi:hypothetical protein